MLNTNSIIESKELTYEPYHQSRGEGFSGQLLVASEVHNPEKKYIIKAAQAHIAACEFMFHKLAEKLGLRTARVRFVFPVTPEEFEYPACAIDFIPNAVKLQYEDFIKIEECEILSHLSYIFGDRDNLDFLKDESGTIYKIDHSDCFGIEGIAKTWLDPEKVTIEHMFYQMSKPMPRIGHYAEKDVLRSAFESISSLSAADFNDDLILVNQFCGAPFEKHFRHYFNELIEQCKAL